MGCPFLCQTTDSLVYHVSEAITTVNSWPLDEAIVAFVNTDESLCKPQRFIRRPMVQIIVASSPKGTHQNWLKQQQNTSFLAKFVQRALLNQVRNSFASLRAALIYLFGIFLHSQDLTYARLKEYQHFILDSILVSASKQALLPYIYFNLRRTLKVRFVPSRRMLTFCPFLLRFSHHGVFPTRYLSCPQ